MFLDKDVFDTVTKIAEKGDFDIVEFKAITTFNYISGKYRYSETLSDFHSWNFDILIVVLFNDDGTLKQVLQMDSKLARTFIHPRKKSGQADIITLSKKFVSAANDITSCFSTYKI